MVALSLRPCSDAVPSLTPAQEIHFIHPYPSPPHPTHPTTPHTARSDDYTLRVKRYFPHVKDFDRAENGDLIWGSLKGPEKIEVRARARGKGGWGVG